MKIFKLTCVLGSLLVACAAFAAFATCFNLNPANIDIVYEGSLYPRTLCEHFGPPWFCTDYVYIKVNYEKDVNEYGHLDLWDENWNPIDNVVINPGTSSGYRILSGKYKPTSQHCSCDTDGTWFYLTFSANGTDMEEVWLAHDTCSCP
jgi:hypothetical protein